MERGDIGFVAGLAGFLLGGWAVFTSLSMKSDLESVMNERKSDEDALAGMGARVEDLDRSQKELTRRVNSVDANPRSVDGRIKEIEERLAALEAVLAKTAPGANDADTAPKSLKADADADEFKKLQEKVFDGSATVDEQQRLWAMLREKPEILAALMKDLEKAVADAPNDIDGRMKLSRAYLAKLFTVPDGPEKGTWSMKAMDQYKKVLDLEPEHWEARYSLAMNYSQWPEFLNKRPDAIREFETLRKMQETKTPEPHFAHTYLQLRNLYLKDNRTDDAKAVLEEGIRRFPDDEELKKLK